MAKFIVTNDSYFQPFTYDDLVKPLQQMTEAHNTAADAYDQLSLETEALNRYISNNPDDQQARVLYDNYINKLNTLKDNLWNRGYNMGTRRDLSSARASYASDILRLQAAVRARQERSKEYWDARHKNPELVAGFDPGISGLDNYLNDDRYGQDWYSYNGTQFINEVATEAKARAAELLNQYIGKADAPGYLTYIQKQGFSNADVNKAGSIAREVLAGRMNLNDVDDSAAKLLAGVLVSRMNSTGAVSGKNLSTGEYDRLLNYGISGLAQGVGEMNAKLIDDKVWEQQQKYALEAYKHSLTAPPPTNPTGYNIDHVSTYVENPDFASQNQLYRRYVHNYNDSPITFIKNGKLDVLTNESDAMGLLDGMGYSSIQDDFNIDPELLVTENGRGSDEVRTEFVMPDGKHVEVRYVKMSQKQKKSLGGKPYIANTDGFDYDPIAVEQHINGKWVLDQNTTDEFNRRYRQYRIQRQQLIDENKDNKDFNIKTLALTGKNKSKFYKNAGIPSYVPEWAAQRVQITKNRQGVESNAVVASHTMKDALDFYSGNIQTHYANGKSLFGDNGISKTSDFAFYPVAAGNVGYSNRGESNPAIVFGTSGTGKSEKVNYGLKDISVSPEDIYDYNKIKITTLNDKQYGVNPAYLGNSVASLTENLRAPIATVWDPDSKTFRNVLVDDDKGLLHYLMSPISDPVRTSIMSPEEQELWYKIAHEYLGEDMVFSIPNRQTGETIPIGPIEILMNDNLQDMLRGAVVNMLDKAYSQPRDWAVQHHFQGISDDSTKPQPYIAR